MMGFELDDIAILHVKTVYYRWWRYIRNMDFGTNKTPVEVIKKGAFGETYFILVLIVNHTENHGRNLKSKI